MRVVVIADDPLVRANLALLVDGDRLLVLAGQDLPGSPPERVLIDHRPGVVLWDEGWQGGAAQGWEGIAQRGVPIVVMAASEESARLAWAGGAQGVLPRDAAPARIRAALLAAAEGLSVIAPDILGPGEGRPSPNAQRTPETLTERELEVLRQISQGLSNKEIAFRLHISESTVKFHVNSLLGKLGAQSRTEAAMLAARAGLIPL